jgi:hypothetical protein
MKFICKLRYYLRTIKYAFKTGDFESEVSGCLFEDVEQIPNCTVTISRCRRCGEEEFSWRRN